MAQEKLAKRSLPARSARMVGVLDMSASFYPLAVCSLDDLRSHVVFGTTTEGPQLEFKRQGSWARASGGQNKRRADQKELCRDISQFANSDGGCLLIGITDDGQSRAKAIEPIADPDSLIQWIESAIHNFLEPRTFAYEVLPVDVPGQGSVVAINVAPSPEPIFVWDTADGTMACYRRDSHGKKPCNPKEVTMFIASTARSTRIRILSRCKVGDRIELFGGIHHQLFVPMGTGNTGTHNELNVHSCHGTHVHLTLVGGDEIRVGVTVARATYYVAIPYGFIEEVWTDAMGVTILSLAYDIIRTPGDEIYLSRQRRRDT